MTLIKQSFIHESNVLKNHIIILFNRNKSEFYFISGFFKLISNILKQILQLYKYKTFWNKYVLSFLSSAIYHLKQQCFNPLFSFYR